MSESRSISILNETDIINARQQTRQMAKDAGLPIIDQARISLAVSSIAHLIGLGNNFSGKIVLNRILESHRSGVQVIWMMDHHTKNTVQVFELTGSHISMMVDEINIQDSEESGTNITAMIWSESTKSIQGSA